MFSGREGWLNGVVAVAPDDVWAVGGQTVQTHRLLGRSRPLRRAQTVERALIEHWDGTAWSAIPSANVGPAAVTRKRYWGIVPASENELLGVAAVSADDIWAVGDYGLPLPKSPLVRQPSYPSRSSPLAEHWNGRKWAVGPRVPLSVVPDTQLPVGFTAVGAAPTGDVLALAPLWGEAWEFSGTAWHQAFRGSSFSTFGVAVIAHDDRWIVGPSSSDPSQPAAFHWDGRAWMAVPLPVVGWIEAASASATDDVWAVGRLAPVGTKTPLVGDNKVLLHYTC
jgi:hypothetical protein